MKRIAVIGAGISGMAAAYYLSRKHEVWLLERDTRLGGHTHTHAVEGSRGPLNVDTGFIVFNTRTYPNLVRLFTELGVGWQPSDMTFSVSCKETDFEYSSAGARGYFAKWRNFLRPAHYGLLGEIMRFARVARRVLSMPQAEELTLGDFLERERFSRRFTEQYLYPMAGAIWSTSLDVVDSFPAVTLLRFFDNHEMLDVRGRPQWLAVRGGSSSYIAPLTRSYRERILLGAKVQSVARAERGVRVQFSDRPALAFDEVVFACPAEQALRLLQAPSDAERSVLSAFQTSANTTWLHTDSRLLPRRERARASWNFHLNAVRNGNGNGYNGNGHRRGVTLTYHMNRLQSLDVPEDYCVTLNPDGEIDESKVLRKMLYHHPLYTLEAIRAQSRWQEINGKNGVHYCGAYWFYGFHEDGLNSGMRVARALGVDC